MKPIFAAAKAAPGAHRLRRGRGRARPARGAGRGRRGARHARSWWAGRPCSSERIERFGLRMKPGERLRGRQPGEGPALPRILDGVPPPHRAARRVAPVRQDRDAPPPHAHRRDDDAQGRGRRHDLRHLRHPRPAPALRRPGDRPAPGREELLRDEHPHAAQAHGVHLRHLRERRSDARAARRDDDARRGGDPPLRPHAQGRAPLPLELRHERRARRRSRCARRSSSSAAACPTSRSKGEMHGDAALSEEVRLARLPELAAARARRTCSSCRRSTPPTSPSTC